MPLETSFFSWVDSGGLDSSMAELARFLPKLEDLVYHSYVQRSMDNDTLRDLAAVTPEIMYRLGKMLSILNSQVAHFPNLTPHKDALTTLDKALDQAKTDCADLLPLKPGNPSSAKLLQQTALNCAASASKAAALNGSKFLQIPACSAPGINKVVNCEVPASLCVMNALCRHPSRRERSSCWNFLSSVDFIYNYLLLRVLLHVSLMLTKKLVYYWFMLMMASVVLTLVNKVFYSTLNINIPILSTGINFGISSMVISNYLKRSFNSVTPHVNKTFLIRRLLPIAILTALELSLSNACYRLVSLPIMTVIKSTNLVSTYLCGILFGLAKFRVPVFLACLVIVVPTGMAVLLENGRTPAPLSAEPVSSLPSSGTTSLGVCLLSIAVICLSLKWVLIQKLAGMYREIDLVYLLSPLTALVLIPVGIIVDLPHWLLRIQSVSDGWIVVGLTAGQIGICALFGFSLLFFEVKVVKTTSSMALVVGGLVKEILALIGADVLFNEKLNIHQWLCVIISLGGLVWYSLLTRKEGEGEGDGDGERVMNEISTSKKKVNYTEIT
jgi:hypothetical protein